MNALRFLPSGLALGLVLFLAGGCDLSRPRAIESGEGNGAAWAPSADGKFLVVDVENRFTEEIEYVCHGRAGIFRMVVEPGKHRYMVLKDLKYDMELRTRTAHVNKAEFLEHEERLLGVRRVHMRAIVKGTAKPALTQPSGAGGR